MFSIKRKRLGILVLALIIGSVLLGCNSKPIEGVVAQVNGENITQEDFDSEYEVSKNIYEREYGEGYLDRLGDDGEAISEQLKLMILEKMVLHKIISQDSESMDISISDTEINESLEESIDSVGGKDEFEEFLEMNQIPRDYFEESLKRELLMDKHKNSFLDNVSIETKEAEDYYYENKEQLIVVRANRILIDTEDKGREILKRLESGEEFSAIATVESLDNISAAKGGDLGYFAKGSLNPELEEKIFALDVGEISDLIKTDVGYEIIQLVDRKDTLEDLKEDIIIVLKEEEYLENVQKLWDKAKIKTFMNNN